MDPWKPKSNKLPGEFMDLRSLIEEYLLCQGHFLGKSRIPFA